MKIAYLNPYRQAAENQAFKSLEDAAQKIGSTLIHCINSEEILAAQPDFVLATASTQPKLTGIPTYGVIHEPRDRFLRFPEYFRNLLSYDGYLTISESIHTYLRNILAGMKRDTSIGFYYNSCQTNQLHSEGVSKALTSGHAKLTYFGTNWDKRRYSFFKKLAKLKDVEIYGPERAWRHIDRGTYKGPLPYDGLGPQKKYAENALGLVLLSDEHLADDVISNRIFEITSVGAIAICPRMPWIEKHYGDSVYYFKQSASDSKIVNELEQVIQQIKSQPQDAVRRARQAYDIFNQTFSAEQLLKNACAYHKECVSRRASQPTSVSVIVRCGGRSLEILGRALESIAQQSAAAFSVLLVRYTELDLSPILRKYKGRFSEIRVLDSFGGNRSATLWLGLKNVSGEYFAILDDDDEWMPNHIEHLLPPEGVPRKPYFGYTGSIRVQRTGSTTAQGNVEIRRISSYGDCRTASFLEAVEFFSSNCFLASTDLLDRYILEPPNIETAEDSLLILELLSKCEPRFNYRATAIHHESADAPDFSNHPGRGRDLLEVMARVAGKIPSRSVVRDISPALAVKNAEFFGANIRAIQKSKSSFWQLRTLQRWHRSMHKRFPRLFPLPDERPRLAQKSLTRGG
jgi:hypothetical protein